MAYRQLGDISSKALWTRLVQLSGAMLPQNLVFNYISITGAAFFPKLTTFHFTSQYSMDFLYNLNCAYFYIP